MTSHADRAQEAENSAEHLAERDRNQRRGVDDDQPAQNPETDPAATEHPTGQAQARENAENDPPG